jgi:hypothetical protein
MFPVFPYWMSPVHFAIACVQTAARNQRLRIQEAALPVLEPLVLNAVFAYNRAKIRAHLRIQALRRSSAVARALIAAGERVSRVAWYVWALFTRKYVEPSDDVSIVVFAQNVVAATSSPRYSSIAQVYSSKYGWPALREFYAAQRQGAYRDGGYRLSSLLWNEFVVKFDALWLELRSQMMLQEMLLLDRRWEKMYRKVHPTLEPTAHRHRHATPEEHRAENTESTPEDEDEDEDDALRPHPAVPEPPSTMDLCQQYVLLVGYFAPPLVSVSPQLLLFREISVAVPTSLGAFSSPYDTWPHDLDKTPPPGQSEVDFLAVEYIGAPGAEPLALEIPRSHYAVGNEILSRTYIYWYLEHLPRYTAWTFSEDYEVRCMDDTLCEVVLRRDQYIKLLPDSYEVVHMNKVERCSFPPAADDHDHGPPPLLPMDAAGAGREAAEQNERLSLQLPKEEEEEDDQWEKIGDSP